MTACLSCTGSRDTGQSRRALIVIGVEHDARPPVGQRARIGPRHDVRFGHRNALLPASGVRRRHSPGRRQSAFSGCWLHVDSNRGDVISAIEPARPGRRLGPTVTFRPPPPRRLVLTGADSAERLFPGATPATDNRNCYAPIDHVGCGGGDGRGQAEGGQSRAEPYRRTSAGDRPTAPCPPSLTRVIRRRSRP